MKIIFSLILLLTIPHDAQFLIVEGKKAGCLNGEFNINFYKEAKKHADYMAKYGRQSHDDFINRKNRLSGDCAEICCESWPGQTLGGAAKDAFTVSWPASSNHWRTAIKACKYYGIASSVGNPRLNNQGPIIYTCLIVGY